MSTHIPSPTAEPPDAPAPNFGAQSNHPASLTSAEKIDLVADLLERQREEWKPLRKLVRDAAEDAEKLSGFEKLKFVKFIADTLKTIQDGERRATSDQLFGPNLYSDSALDSLSDEELGNFAAGRRLTPRHSAQPRTPTAGKPR